MREHGPVPMMLFLIQDVLTNAGRVSRRNSHGAVSSLPFEGFGRPQPMGVTCRSPLSPVEGRLSRNPPFSARSVRAEGDVAEVRVPAMSEGGPSLPEV